MKEYSKKTAIVTGATGAIGKAIARQMAQKNEFGVVLVGRNPTKTQQTALEIQKVTGNSQVLSEVVDLSSRSSIEQFANRWKGPLDVLINNAAITPRHRQENSEGIELQFSTNVLGYFRMIRAFQDTLSQSAPSRIINVASYWAGGLEMDDLEFQKRKYHNDQAYRQSKQANRMLTVAFAQRLKGKGIAVNACHPGDVNSTLSNNLGFGGHQTPDEGAATPVWLATTQEGVENTGKYFERKKESSCHFREDQKAIEELYEICLSYDS